MTKTGRIAIYNGLGQPLEIKEYPVPDPEPGAILVKVTLANVCGSDLHMWRGDIDIAALGSPMPAVFGHEMTGTVAQLGSGVTTDSTGQPLTVGDRVVYRYFNPCGRCAPCLRGEDTACFANLAYISSAEVFPHFRGAYADYYYAYPNQTVIKVPDDLTDEMVAPVNCALAEVIYGLQKVRLGFGETIVIQGAGGLGIYATAVAREMGAHKIIVVEGIDERVELAKSFGADEIVDMKQYKTPEERVMRVLELTGFQGAHVVAELAGIPAALPEGINMLGQGGRCLEIGNISPGRTTEIDPALLVMGSKTIYGVTFYDADALKKSLELLSRTKDKYPFERILSRKYPLENINQAFEDQNNGLVSRSAIVP
jgi:D-arabinose 1-dehydrogenase-like Zn-dependent alcohol dehydrogenase